MKVFQDDLEDFYQIFSNLDQGGSIDISEIDNPKIQKYLKKIFKYLRLQKDSTDYKKDLIKNPFNLKQKIQNLIEKSYFDERSSSSEDDSHSDEETKILSTKINENLNPKVEIPKKIEIKEQIAQPIEKIEPIPHKKIYGASFISEEEKKKFLEQSLTQELEVPKIEREKWMEDDNLNDFIDNSFKKVDDSNKEPKQRKEPKDAKRMPKYLQSLFEKNNDDPNDPKKTEAEEKEEENIKEYMKEYDIAHNRQRSLMDEHKEKIRDKKNITKNKIPERKAFDRSVDLQINKFDSKNIFSILNSGDNALSNRFSNSKFEKSFL